MSIFRFWNLLECTTVDSRHSSRFSVIESAMNLSIDPKVDFAFKLVFGSPEHTGITIHFLNAVLTLSDPITSVEILNPICGKDFADDKLVILDVLARDQAGRHFNIEMQTSLPTDLPKRLTYYNTLNYRNQLREGCHYRDLRPAISICVLNQMLYRNLPNYHLSFRLRCDQHALVFTDEIVFHTLELPKFNRSKSEISGCSAIEKWLYFLKYAEQTNAKDLVQHLVDPEFEEAVGVLTMISKSPEDRQFYEDRMKFLMDQEGLMIAARMEGMELGIEKGREEGKLLGQLKVYQQLLGQPETSSTELQQLSLSELANIIADLQQQLRDRR